ncbi:MAG TPA: twin-arginine translocase TatA/TatE family subunit [Flavisolibacter sp.]|nr:twin-arginine translocase TatA/TatE family subunit [Flavisolibacter sp.]
MNGIVISAFRKRSMGFKEILIILVVILLLFGAKKLPELMRGAGRGLKEFKREKDGGEGGHPG